MLADASRLDRHPADMDEHDIIDLLELQRLTGELLDHLTAMFRSYAAHSADSASACCSTFCTAASCKSGG